jgi:hypothetical protein
MMHDAREAFRLGRICYGGAALYPDQPSAMAKFHVAELLDIPVGCVERFRQNAGLS